MSRPTASLAILVCLAVAGCSGKPAPTPQQLAAQRHAAAEAAAKKKQAMYERLLQLKNYTLAVPLGEEIVRDYPGTAAAKAVGAHLDQVRKEGQERAEKQRLQGLWSYQVGPMAGGTQSTAAIESSEPSGDGQVRLVLRRHSSWGQSVFLFGHGKGFVCHGLCKIPMSFDGHHRRFTAYRPDGKQPALFIKDDKAFIHDLEKAHRITMDVNQVEGGKTRLLYEVGGFDASQWQPVKSKKK